MSSENIVEIYTDGACSGNPGPGGWGVLMRWNGVEREFCGGEQDTTNNRMELSAAIQGLLKLKRPVKVALYTDSTYVKDGITKWIFNWKKNGWKTAAKKPVKNADLWQDLEKAIAKHDVEWHWVKGHDGHEENERADALAREGVEKIKNSLIM